MTALVKRIGAGLLGFLLLAAAAGVDADTIRVGSKNFNESYVLAEIIAQRLEAAGFDVERRYGLGGTLICFEALQAGEIDLYVEYTGTLSQVVLGSPDVHRVSALDALVAEQGLTLLAPFGFSNTYAIAVSRALAREKGLERIGDLAAHPELDVVVSHEFLEREDGWRGLARAYGLGGPVRGIEHGLAYQAMEAGSIQVTDAYSTDGELEHYDLVILEDDLGYFPEYLAVPLARRSLPAAAVDTLSVLAGTIDDVQMQAMNAQVVFGGRSFAEVANGFLVERGLASARADESTLLADLRRNTAQHLKLTVAALTAAVLVGVGVSLVVFRTPLVSRMVIYLCGLLQTVPSIALLALLIPLLGIGVAPAILALFLYSLLPILRNTITALTTIDPTLTRVAVAMGLSRREQLRYVYLPLSLPSMFAGIRTAAVISIGTATLAAFIGAGGLGDPIVTGLALNDVNLILQGAIPAALLAVITELVFELFERWLIPGHLR